MRWGLIMAMAFRLILLALVFGSQAADFQHDPGWRGRPPFYDQCDLAPDHHFGQLRAGQITWQAFSHDPATPDDTDAVGDIKDFIQFMGDEH